MEYSEENFRFYVLAEVKRGVPAKAILQHLRDSFGNAAPSQTFVYKWHKTFSSGERLSIETLPRSGRPASLRTDANISKVFDFVEDNPKATLTVISGSLQLSRSSVHRILVDELFYRKVCSVWVPHTLTVTNKQQRINCCHSIRALFDDYSEHVAVIM